MDVVDFYEDKLAIIFSDTADARRRGRVESRPDTPARRQAAAAERARLPLHHRRQLHGHVAVEGLARRHARPRRRSVSSARPTIRARTSRPTRRATRAATGTIPARRSTRTISSSSRRTIRGPVEVVKLPKDWKKTQDQLGKISFDPNTSDDENSRWNMFEDEVQPYQQGRRREDPGRHRHAGRADRRQV